MSHVIVLNADYNLLSTMSVKKARSYIAQEKVRLLKAVDSVPRVVQWLRLVVAMHRKGVPWTKRNVHIRDRYTCVYCGDTVRDKSATIDHVIPQDRGGKNTFENTVSSCFSCNNKKKNRTPNEAGMSFVKRGFRPYKPTVMEFYLIRFRELGIYDTLKELGVW